MAVKSTFARNELATRYSQLATHGAVYTTAPGTALVAPVISLGTTSTGGGFAAGTYFWKLTAINAQGETIGSNEITKTLVLNDQQVINWTAIGGATGYKLYRGTSAGGQNVLIATLGLVTTVTDTGAAGTAATVPTTNTSAGDNAAGSEPVGGTPAYARKALAWSAAANGVLSATATFDIAAGVTIVGTGVHNALTGGSYIDGKTETAVNFPTQDTVTVTYSFSMV